MVSWISSVLSPAQARLVATVLWSHVAFRTCRPVMMLGEVSLQSQPQLGDLGAHPPFGQVSQLARIVLAPDQGSQHGSPRLTQDVGGHRSQLDVRSFQDLVDAI